MDKAYTAIFAAAIKKLPEPSSTDVPEVRHGRKPQKPISKKAYHLTGASIASANRRVNRTRKIKKNKFRQGRAGVLHFAVSRYGSNNYGLYRNLIFYGGLFAVGKFRLGENDFAAQEAAFDLDIAVRGGDGYKISIEYASLNDLAADAERDTLLEQKFLKPWSIFSFTKN